jgi:hypothetical protein
VFAVTQVMAGREVVTRAGVGDVNRYFVALCLRSRFGSGCCLLRRQRSAANRKDEQSDNQYSTHLGAPPWEEGMSDLTKPQQSLSRTKS